LGNNRGDFQLHRFTTSENIAKVLGGYFFDSHCMSGKNLPLSVDVILNFFEFSQLPKTHMLWWKQRRSSPT